MNAIRYQKCTMWICQVNYNGCQYTSNNIHLSIYVHLYSVQDHCAKILYNEYNLLLRTIFPIPKRNIIQTIKWVGTGRYCNNGAKVY